MGFIAAISLRRWALVGATLVCSVVIFFGTRGSALRSGGTRTVALTVTPADETGLRCYSNKDFEGHTCQGNAPSRLAPYVTVDRELVVLAGVFSHPAVRAESARRSTMPKDRQRFSVSCRIKHLAFSGSIKIRFGKGKVEPAQAWIAVAEQCDLQP